MKTNQDKTEAMTEEVPASCANCGKVECGETSKLMAYGADKLVKVCGSACRIQYEIGCKKQAYDEVLFKQPSKRDDCPICFLPLPVRMSGQVFVACCSKVICSGCSYAHRLQSSGRPTCPFCRASPSSPKECIEMIEKRVDANDAGAIYQLATLYLHGDGDLSIKKDIDNAVNLFHLAADLGSAPAYTKLGYISYDDGDEFKAKHYFEKAAMAGCTDSRFNLGCIDANAGSLDRAIKHWMIAATCGEIQAVNKIKKAMTDGDATRDHYAQALRGYTEYLKDVRSNERDRAAAYSDDYKYLLEA
jgi:hypothetical protein